MSIIHFRRRNNLSQLQLAEKIGVSASMVAQWESGKKNPSYQSLKELAKMGATLSDLFDIEEMEHKVLQVAEPQAAYSAGNEQGIFNSEFAASIIKRLEALEQTKPGETKAG